MNGCCLHKGSGIQIWVRDENMGMNSRIFASRQFEFYNQTIIGLTDDSIKIWKNEMIGFIYYIDLTSSNKPFKNYSIIYFPNIVFAQLQSGEYISVINPSLDKEQNKKNFRNPEQTKKLIEANGGNEVELPQGLTMDAKGRLFLNGEIQIRDYDMFLEYFKKRNEGLKSPYELVITAEPEFIASTVGKLKRNSQ